MNLFIALVAIVLIILFSILTVGFLYMSTCEIVKDDRYRQEKYRFKMFKNISFEHNNEFELIYNQLMNSDLTEVKSEKSKNILNTIVGVMLIIINCICIEIAVYISEVKMLVIIIPLAFAALYFFIKFENIKYKEQVIRNFLYFINPQIEYKVANGTFEQSKIYKRARFRDAEADGNCIRETMKYELDNNVVVLLEDLQLTNSSPKRQVFDGVIAEISRSGNSNTDILIERNKMFNGAHGMKNATSKFERYFDLSSNADSAFVINEKVKEKLLALYEEYKIIFEISLKGNNIYIRFFTGPMFVTNMFGPLVDKKQLYKEYIIFTNILKIIKEVNQIFAV